MNKREELIPIGIASSVAKTSNFNWMKTIEIVLDLDISVIQLHLNQFKFDFDWQMNLAERFDQIYMHLPNNFNHSHSFIDYITKLSNAPLLIQHEQYLKKNDIDFFLDTQLSLGFENDQQDNLYGYINYLTELDTMGMNFFAVIDLPRFYHQFYNKHTIQEIYSHVLKILKRCKSFNIPVIIHAIDITNYQADQTSWVPIFEGILPWDGFLSFLIDDFFGKKPGAGCKAGCGRLFDRKTQKSIPWF
ncbi:MAG: hypothetical protein P8Y99_09555 [Calditrichaceae bacterium]